MGESPASIRCCKHPRSHLFGTDKVGTDVFYRALKGIRTALIIGGFTTLTAIPFALCFGVVAGYFGGRVDDIVQYIYSTLASIPSILLIVAFMLLFGHGLFKPLSHLGDQQLDGAVSAAARRDPQAAGVRIYPSRRSLRRESVGRFS